MAGFSYKIYLVLSHETVWMILLSLFWLYVSESKPKTCAEEGRWSAMRVVDESARLAGLWRVSVGLQDGAQAERAILMFVWHFVAFAVLHIHFGVSGQMWNTIDELPNVGECAPIQCTL